MEFGREAVAEHLVKNNMPSEEGKRHIIYYGIQDTIKIIEK